VVEFEGMEAPRGKQRGIFPACGRQGPERKKSIRIRASNPRPKGRGMRRAVRVQKAMNQFNSQWLLF